MLQIDGYEAGFRVRCDRFRVHMKQQKCKDSVTKVDFIDDDVARVGLWL